MQLLHAGLDIGSTTAKVVVLDDDDRLIFSRYMRHFADIQGVVKRLVTELKETFFDTGFTMSVAGSGALELARGMDVPFTQEQIACTRSIGRYLPQVDVCIELGGEDAKLTFFDPSGAEQRMNETCSGGTGAFIDQMAALLGLDAAGLNELAKDHHVIYPIASRCGVFAKTDVQPLLNDGASRADIAASIFQAIVNQTIGGLACGRRIHGRVAFLGGPLYFLSELRRRFEETLKLTPEQCIFPDNPHLFVAIGAAINAKSLGPVSMDVLQKRAESFFVSHARGKSSSLPPLFENSGALSGFRKRHSRSTAARAPLADYRGDAYLGIDAGSTTTKAVLTGSDGQILFSSYRATGGGEPVKTVRDILSDLYSRMPEGVRIKSSAATGYGEKLVQSAFGVDMGEVETVAHAKAAEFYLPGVDFVIDIGGQDMKCIGLKHGVIDRVFLNEACSSGCGSFIQSFAESLRMDVSSFAAAAVDAAMPVDLGSRCTVFMNSRVRQAQKDGAAIGDISAGLVYAVVRNALYKVLKIKNADELGERIVVQGGTFRNDAVLRAFELLTGREVTRPDIPELMGAFGAALIARDRAKGGASSLISAKALASFSSETSTFRCKGCGNACILTCTKFQDGRSYISGNKCENGAAAHRAKTAELPPNVCEMKYRRIFDHYTPLAAGAARRGIIGIPRVLNMYEDYPFWFTLFTKLGFRVELSSARPDPELGIDTISSQTVCYPAKLVHRHISELLARGVKTIFYPILQTEKKEFAAAQKNYNCPVVTGYPDVAYLNIEGLRADGVNFMRPAVSIESQSQTAEALFEVLSPFVVQKAEIMKAVEAASKAQAEFRADVASFGRDALRYLLEHNGRGVILAGHPYHLDPEVNHGIPALINGYGVTIFTEDSVCGMTNEPDEKCGVSAVDQWVFHSRLYRAAAAAVNNPAFKNVELIQLNSFGCGLDAISSEQTAELLERGGKLYTLLKIDEGRSTGAVNIRIRSLLAAMDAARSDVKRAPEPARRWNIKEPRTILCPPLSPHHFQFLGSAFRSAGLDLRVLPEGTRETAELGLRYVNNDICCPAAFVVGQFIDALKSGLYDPERTDCLYAQTGGACRASNYVRGLRRALDAAGFSNVRVLAANAQKGGDAEKLEVPVGVLWRSALGMLYGDLMMRLLLATRPRETERGASGRLYDMWKERASANVLDGSWFRFRRNVREMVRDFEAIPVIDAPRVRVGVVGEIMVKYHGGANDHLVETIESEGGEAVVPELANFLLYCLYDSVYVNKKLGGAFMPRLLGQAGIGVLEGMRAPVREALESSRFGGLERIGSMLDDVKGLVSPSNQAGEGWLLTAEMVRLIESGVRNILCIQPFSCLPNHITGKGVIRELKRRYGSVNILPLDYDVSVSSVNQLNRIKLLMGTSRV